MKQFTFWRGWLITASLLMTAMGLAIALFPDSALMDTVFNKQIDSVFTGDEGFGEQAALFKNWIYGVLGMTITGWGIMMIFVAYLPFGRKESWAWLSFFISITLWFLIDTSISLYYNVDFNVFFNAAILLLFLIPLLLTKKEFLKQKSG